MEVTLFSLQIKFYIYDAIFLPKIHDNRVKKSGNAVFRNSGESLIESGGGVEIKFFQIVINYLSA